MEGSLASLTYKGSIAEAILEAKRQKKLFVVYVSGDDAESKKLEESTWNDLSLAELLSKHCVLLHIHEGSTDAANFCAIYPYSSIPCVTAIGFNGAQVWKNEGFIAADTLASELEKASFSIHIQETAAILSTALASQNSQRAISSASSTGQPTEGSSPEATLSSSSRAVSLPSSERESLVTPAIKKEDDVSTNAQGYEVDKKLPPKLAGPSNSTTVTSDQSAFSAGATKKSAVIGDENRISAVETKKDVLRSVTTESESQLYGNLVLGDGNRDLISGKKVDSGRDATEVVSKEETCYQKDDATGERNKDKMDSSQSISKSTDVHLNIRMPDGASLQEKFAQISTLRMVKDYVDNNQTNIIGSYALAIPYPRRVFSDQDLSKSLSDLGLLNRQALIVVPTQRATAYDKRGSSSTGQTSSRTNPSSDNESDAGYFGYVRRVLSYMNPFSYFGGGTSSSNSALESESAMWEFGPNPGLRNTNSETDSRRTYIPSSSARGSTTGTNDLRNRNRRPTASSGPGSNIHTLKRDEDDAGFGDRNAFWNGNSTQYGGDNNGR